MLSFLVFLFLPFLPSKNDFLFCFKDFVTFGFNVFLVFRVFPVNRLSSVSVYDWTLECFVMVWVMSCLSDWHGVSNE